MVLVVEMQAATPTMPDLLISIDAANMTKLYNQCLEHRIANLGSADLC
jgi:hypothetical protein